MQTRKLPMRARMAASGIGVVHDVVVDQRAGLEELKCCDRSDDLGAVITAGSAPPPVREGGAQPLAAREKGAGGVQDGEQLFPNGVEHRLLAFEESLELFVHADAEVFSIERRALRGHTGEAICPLARLQPEASSTRSLSRTPSRTPGCPLGSSGGADQIGHDRCRHSHEG